MTAGEESIREQLQRLLGIKPQRDERAPMRPSAGPEPKKDREQPRRGLDAGPIDQSWKEGVRPLKVKGKYIGPAKFGPSRFPRGRPSRGHPSRPVLVADEVLSRKPKVRASQPDKVAVPAVRPSVPPASPAKAPLPALPRDVPTPALSTTVSFRIPDRWVEEGRQLQLDDGKGPTLLVRIGIDFGTAYSKLAVGVAGKVFLLDLDGLVGVQGRYLLAGELSELGSGEAYVGRAPDAREVSTNLKLPFLGIDRPARPIDIARAATFVAWMMRYARAWLYENKPQLLRGNRLVWEANIGAPTGTWKKGDRLLQHYQQIGLVAWRLSQAEKVTVRSALELLESTAAGSLGWGLDYLGIVPEFAAQVAGYVKSPQRTDGLYLLADIGAGTLDVACFRIMQIPKTPRDRFPVFASDVQPLGTHYLMQAREHLTGRRLPEWTGTRKVPDSVSFASAAGIPLKSVQDADRAFEQLVSSTVHRVLTQTRFVMEKTAPEWRNGMPVFFAGGGAGLEPYRRAVAQAFRSLGYEHIPRSFPRSRNLEASFRIDDEAGSRMSVAHGLTFDAAEIGELIPPTDIPPHTILSWPTRERPDRDDLYPK